jgi:hypothetical protein
MATTLIDTRKSIMAQIHESWNEFRTTEGGYEWTHGMPQPYEARQKIPFAEEFKKSDAPWTIKQSVLEKNTVHANKLIRLYIALNIDEDRRMLIFEFFEIGNGVVGKIKEQTKLLKRIQKALKLEQQLGLVTSDATKLFLTQDVGIDELEADLKVKVKEASKAAKAEAKAAKKLALKAARASEKEAKVAAKAAKAGEAKKHKRLVQFVKKANEYIRWCRANKLEDLMVGMIEFCPPNELYEVPTQSQKTLGRVAHEY